VRGCRRSSCRSAHGGHGLLVHEVEGLGNAARNDGHLRTVQEHERLHRRQKGVRVSLHEHHALCWPQVLKMVPPADEVPRL
jgi:hypothetical protein